MNIDKIFSDHLKSEIAFNNNHQINIIQAV